MCVVVRVSVNVLCCFSFGLLYVYLNVTFLLLEVLSNLLKISPCCFVEFNSSSEDSPLAVAITRLLSLEKGIERRYLKHPLRNE